MSLALIHPTVAAINGGKLLKLVPLGYVERIIETTYDEVMAALVETPGYNAFEKSVSGPNGWPDPAEPMAFKQSADGQWWVVSGLEQFIAAKRLGLTHIEAIFLNSEKVGEWQIALNRFHDALNRKPEDEADLELLVASHYA